MRTKLLIASILTGIFSGIFISLYGLLSKFLSYVLFLGNPYETIPSLPVWYLYLVPTISILFVNYLISKDASLREYGVKEIADAVENNKLSMSIKSLFLKVIASALSIASGFAIGDEGPSAAIGAMIGQKMHTLFKLSKETTHVMLSVGASSGIAAIFVSPITGVAFALENIAYTLIKSYMGYMILASVLAFAIAINFLNPTLFTYSSGKMLHVKYLYADFIFIFVILFFVCFYFILKDNILYFINKVLSNKFQKHKNLIFALIGGGTIGTTFLIAPYATFSGHELVNYLINDKVHLSISLIIVTIFLRIIATTISIYANAIGGLFITLMSIGALIGYAFGEVMLQFGFDIEPFYFAAIGASAFMGVVMELPLTAVVLALETTYDYNVVISVGIIVSLVSFMVPSKLRSEDKLIRRF